MKVYSWAVLLGLILGMFVQGLAQARLEFKVEGMSCAQCARTATQVLSEMRGVDSAYVNFDSKKAVVIGDAKQLSSEKVKRTLQEHTSFEAVFPGESLPKPLTAQERSQLDYQVIKGGQKLDFADYLAGRKLTIFDFYADWCGPCRVFSPKLERLLLGYSDVALRKVDIVNWDSPVAQQLTKTYRMPALPFVLIFNEKEKLIGKVVGNEIEKVKKILDKHLK